MRHREKRSNGGVYVALFIAFIMVSSIVGFLWGQNSTDTQSGSSTYKEITFKKTQNGWSTKIDGTLTQFRFHPSEVESILFSQNEHLLLSNGPLYIAYDPSDEKVESLALAQFELANAFTKKNIQVIPAMTKNNSFGVTIANCETKGVVLIIDAENTSDVKTTGTCIAAKGDPLEIEDRILYDLYKIIPTTN